VSTQKIKLLFTCPHGGEQDLDVLRVENPACNEDEFITVGETKTRELTESICNKIETMNGQHPHMIRASHRRRYVDFNRKKECAFEVSSLAAEKAYLEYHDDISQKINEMFSQNDNGLAFLFDIHGFREKVDEHGNPFDVIVGNDEGNSIRALNKADPGAFWGDNGLIPLLKNKGYNVLPRNLNERLAGHTLDGGYTIQKYSSDELGRGLVAIQIEVALSIREDDNRREEFAAELADCIFNFVSPFRK
jgi:N-formylglutamate amidohydrolase